MGPNQNSEVITGLRDCIAKFFNISNLVSHLSSQVNNVSDCLIKTVNKVDIKKIEIEDLALMDLMESDELRRMANIEHERRAVMDTWRALEAQKRQIVELAKNRIAAGQGGND